MVRLLQLQRCVEESSAGRCGALARNFRAGRRAREALAGQRRSVSAPGLFSTTGLCGGCERYCAAAAALQTNAVMFSLVVLVWKNHSGNGGTQGEGGDDDVL